MTRPYFPPKLQCFGSFSERTLLVVSPPSGTATDRDVPVPFATEPRRSNAHVPPGTEGAGYEDHAPRPHEHASTADVRHVNDDTIDVDRDTLTVDDDVLSVDDDVLSVD